VLVTGAVADRFGRRLVMGAAIALELACAVAILFFTSAASPARCRSSSRWPAWAWRAPSTARPRSRWSSTWCRSAISPTPSPGTRRPGRWPSIVGPVAGGLLYGIGADVAYGVAAAMFAVSLRLIARVPKPPVRGEVKKVTFSSLFDGLRFIRKEKVVLGAISLDLFAVLLGGAVALLPAYARDILHLGPWGLGLLRAAPGIGAIAMAAFLAASPITRTMPAGSCCSLSPCSAFSP
jgi:MFS family permease